MKTVLAALAAVAALAAAAPVAAQPWPGGARYEDPNWRGRLDAGYVDGLAWRINEAARDGRISWGYARQLRRELRQVQPLAWRVEAGRASHGEYRRLARVVARVEGAVGYAAYGRYPRYGYNRR